MAKPTFSRMKSVVSRTGLSRSSIYEMIRRGQFPRQVHFGPRTSVWSDEEVDAWIAQRVADSRKEAAL